MTITGLLLAIAILLSVLAAVGVRVALSLRDIGGSLDRIADKMGDGGQAVRSMAVPAADQGESSPAATHVDDTEIAAIIAAAARFARANDQERMNG